MKKHPIKMISTQPIDDYDAYDPSIILPPGLIILANKNNNQYMIIGDGNSQLSSLQLYALKTEEELNNIGSNETFIYTNELVTSLPISVADFDVTEDIVSTNIEHEDLVIGNIITALEYETLYK